MEGAESLGWCSTSSGLMEVGLMTGGAGGAVGLCVWGKNYIFINRLKTTPPPCKKKKVIGISNILQMISP